MLVWVKMVATFDGIGSVSTLSIVHVWLCSLSTFDVLLHQNNRKLYYIILFGTCYLLELFYFLVHLNLCLLSVCCFTLDCNYDNMDLNYESDNVNHNYTIL